MNLFIQNKYTKWYYNIIQNATRRVNDSTIYSEKHHIIPKCMGGNNSKDNLVLLYFREHFIVHMLLPKMCVSERHKRQMYHALSYFRCGPGKRILTSRQAEITKEAHIKACKGKKMSEESRRKISKANTGKKRTSEQKELLSNINKGRKHTEETKTKISNSHKLIMTEERKAEISKMNTGREFSEQHKLNISKSKLGNTPWNKGIPHTEETKEKMSCEWIITKENGDIIKITNINKFCKNNGYTQQNLCQVMKGYKRRHKDIIKVEKL